MPESIGELPEPFVCGNRTHNAPKSTDSPLPTATTTTGGRIFLAEPTVTRLTMGQQSGATARPDDLPIATISTGGAIAAIEATAIPVPKDVLHVVRGSSNPIP
ncbi:MAG: hypothetical protein ACR2M1_05195 [Gemmatimonadaceae bacterium]